MFCVEDFIVELQDHVPPKKCVNANNGASPVRGPSIAKISLLHKLGVSHVLTLSDCVYFSDHPGKLFIVSSLGQKGAQVVFDDSCKLRCSDKVSFPFVQSNGLYVTEVFQFVIQTFSELIKLIVIFGIADCSKFLCTMLKSYRSWLKE